MYQGYIPELMKNTSRTKQPSWYQNLKSSSTNMMNSGHEGPCLSKSKLVFFYGVTLNKKLTIIIIYSSSTVFIYAGVSVTKYYTLIMKPSWYDASIHGIYAALDIMTLDMIYIKLTTCWRISWQSYIHKFSNQNKPSWYDEWNGTNARCYIIIHR